MTGYILDHQEKIDSLVNDLLIANQSIDPQKQQQGLIRFFSTVMNVAEKLESQMYQDATDSNDLVLDLEHIISVGADKVNIEKLPEEFRNLTPNEYLLKLKEVIEARRNQKDWAAIYKVIKQRSSNIVNFMKGMENRQYDIRYKNPDCASSEASAVGPKQLSPINREEPASILAKNVPEYSSSYMGSTATSVSKYTNSSQHRTHM